MKTRRLNLPAASTCAGARGEHREPLLHRDCATLLTDARERSRRRLRQRPGQRAVWWRWLHGDVPAARTGPRARPALAAPEQAAAGGRRRGPRLEEGAPLPGATVLARMYHHLLRRHWDHRDEPAAFCHMSAVVAEVFVLPAAGRPVHGGAGPGATGGRG